MMRRAAAAGSGELPSSEQQRIGGSARFWGLWTGPVAAGIVERCVTAAHDASSSATAGYTVATGTAQLQTAVGRAKKTGAGEKTTMSRTTAYSRTGPLLRPVPLAFRKYR